MLCWNQRVVVAFAATIQLFTFKAAHPFHMCGQFLPPARKFQILIFHIQMRRAFGGVHALLGLPLVIFRAPGHRSIPY
jgi:hypothetical protein